MAYTATFTVSTQFARRQPLGKKHALLSGTLNLSVYHATLAEITGITKHFRVIPVCADAISSNGYLLRWDATTGAFKAFKMPSGTTGGALSEVANGVDVGTATVIAIGME